MAIRNSRVIDSVPLIRRKHQNIKAQVSEKRDHIPGLSSFEKSAKLSKNAYICCEEKFYGVTVTNLNFSKCLYTAGVIRRRSYI